MHQILSFIPNDQSPTKLGVSVILCGFFLYTFTKMVSRIFPSLKVLGFGSQQNEFVVEGRVCDIISLFSVNKLLIMPILLIDRGDYGWF